MLERFRNAITAPSATPTMSRIPSLNPFGNRPGIGLGYDPESRFGASFTGANRGALTPQNLTDPALRMPYGGFGGRQPSMFGAPSSGSLGRSGIYADPFGGFNSSQPRSTLTAADRAIGLRMQGGDRFGNFNPYSLDPGAMRAPATSFARSPTAARLGTGGIGSDMLRAGQNQLYAQPWHSLIPGNRGLNIPEIIKQTNYAAGANRQSPAALANLLTMEGRWNPRTVSPSGGHFGATQIQPSSFREAGGRLGGMTLNEFKRAPLERQIAAYPDYLAFYGRQPSSGAALARSDIRHHPVPLQSAIMMGAQFSPYGGLPRTIDWPGAFRAGNMEMPITTGRQADRLSYVPRTPPTLGSMDAYFRGATPR